MFSARQTVERRLKRYESKLKLDIDRVLGWGFAQAVLSAVWMVEDGLPVDRGNSSIMLANTIHSMLQ